jgi:hypothetical protein
MTAWNLRAKLFYILFFLLLAVPFKSLWAAEDTAHLTFQKPVISKQHSFLYAIRKGDALSRIISIRLGPVSSEERRKIYKIIKELNPKLTNFHKIYAGQKLRLPEKRTVSGNRNIKISALQVSSGGIPIESNLINKATTGIFEKSNLPTGYRMAVIREVIQGMNGTITTMGNYYIPIPQAGQVTIDCSRIPVVELPDGSTVLLDFTERVPAPFKSMIQTHWPSYRFVTANYQEDPAQILQKVINASNTYAMIRSQKPLSLGDIPHIELFVDWMINEKSAAGKSPYLKGISFLKDRTQILPKSVKDYASRNGVTLTEFLEGTGVVESPALQSRLPEITLLSSTSAMDLCSALLRFLDYQPTKDVDLKIFDQSRDGFNLAVKAELLVRKDNRQITFHSKELPRQFMDILKERNIDVITFDEKDSKQAIIEKTLSAMKIPFSKGIFLYPVADQAGKPRATISFPAIKMTRDKSLFHFIEFSMDQNLYQLLYDKWEAKLIRF